MCSFLNNVQKTYCFLSALFITFLTTKVRSQEHCRPEQLMECTKPLSLLTDSGLTFVSSKADLDKICPDLQNAIDCINRFSRYCMNREHKRHFKKLFHGTVQTAKELCHNESYQQEYLNHAPCLKKVEPRNDICFKRYTKKMHEIQSQQPINISETDIITYQKRKRAAADEGIKNVCCSFQEYIECTTSVAYHQCGEDAAEFSRKFLDKMSSAMIQLHCVEYGPRECGLLSSASSQMSFSWQQIVKFVAMATVIPILLL